MITRFLKKYPATIIYTLIIMYLSFTPMSTFKGIPTVKFEDKFVHFLIYVLYSVVLVWDMKKAGVTKKTEIVLIAVVYPILFGGFIEIMQETFFKPRSAEWLDWFADIAGALLGYLIANLIFRKKTQP